MISPCPSTPMIPLARSAATQKNSLGVTSSLSSSPPAPAAHSSKTFHCVNKTEKYPLKMSSSSNNNNNNNNNNSSFSGLNGSKCFMCNSNNNNNNNNGGGKCGADCSSCRQSVNNNGPSCQVGTPFKHVISWIDSFNKCLPKKGCTVTSVTSKKMPNVYKNFSKIELTRKIKKLHLYKSCLRMWEVWAN